MTHIDMEIDAIKMEAKIDYDWVHADGTEGGELSIILNIHISLGVKVSLYLFHRWGKPRPSDFKVRRGGARVKPRSGQLPNLV